MSLTYDAEANAACVYLVDAIVPGRVAHTAASMLDLDQAFIAFDFDSRGKLLGIEILGASRVLKGETLSTANRRA